MNNGIVSDIKFSQAQINAWNTKLMEQALSKPFVFTEYKPPTKWQTFKYRVQRILSYRIIIKSKYDSCDCEEW